VVHAVVRPEQRPFLGSRADRRATSPCARARGSTRARGAAASRGGAPPRTSGSWACAFSARAWLESEWA
jgi:hypothetical protein